MAKLILYHGTILQEFDRVAISRKWCYGFQRYLNHKTKYLYMTL